ncbi:alpha/beta fold hydrolase [Phenylobacterium montanum]|uniref:Alpha/beta hydrolase n=1 Tax=Phenylobacterium montanum TaxID=2823693 RepID=A0A975G303_9CAUL|nr:alpha/beta hydrolase [Caulobacter sp. S6]QUD89562.1 alpha/beta hydrolase [Caulobacter sp. S6]
MNGSTRRSLTLGLGAALAAAAAGRAGAGQAADEAPVDARKVIADVQALPGGIDELKAVEINGLKQWIHVRGADRRNPILLFIHGGPGSPMMPEAWSWERPWEDLFTMVQWDQRGAGKTYASAGGLGPQPLTVDLMLSDAKAVVAYLRQTYGREKIFVLGHSWGSLLGLMLAHAIPDQLYAYIGVGQAVSGRLNEEVGYRETLEAARRKGDQAAIKALEAIAPYPGAGPLDLEKLVAERQWDVALGGMRYGQDHAPEMPIWSLSPDYTEADLATASKGELESVMALAPQLPAVDLRSIVDYRCPIFFFAGVDDRTTPTSVVERYFTSLRAPKKRLFVMEHAAHYVVDEAPGLVLLDLAREVRPLAP